MVRKLRLSAAVSVALLSLLTVYASCSRSPTAPSSATPVWQSALGGFVEEGYGADRCAKPNEGKLNEKASIVPQGRIELKSTPTGSTQKPGERKLQLQIAEGGVCQGKCGNKPCQGFVKSGKWRLHPANQTAAEIVGPDDQTEVLVRARRDVAAFTEVTLILDLSVVCSVKCPVCEIGFLEECASEAVTLERKKVISINPARAR